MPAPTHLMPAPTQLMPTQLMKVWRLTSPKFADSALDGEGAARFGGRWNPPGSRMVYLADSLALATLELSVHLPVGRVAYTAIRYDVPEALIAEFDIGGLRRTWRDRQEVTRRIGEAWLRTDSSLALRVPSAVVDPASGERNLLLNPRHRSLSRVREVQRLDLVLDERL